MKENHQVCTYQIEGTPLSHHPESSEHHAPRPKPHPKHEEEKPSPPLESATQAFQLASGAVKKLQLGVVWEKKGPKDAGRFDAALRYEDRVVGRLRLTTSGTILPKGVHFSPEMLKEDLKKAHKDLDKNSLGKIVANLEYAPGLEADKKSGLWKLPLIHHELIVADLFISPDGLEIVEDEKATDEIAHL